MSISIQSTAHQRKPNMRVVDLLREISNLVCLTALQERIVYQIRKVDIRKQVIPLHLRERTHRDRDLIGRGHFLRSQRYPPETSAIKS